MCAGEFPLIKELYAKFKDRGLVVIGVSLDEDLKTIQGVVSRRGLTWPQIQDGKEGQIARLYNVKGTPTYYVLGRDGKIAAKSIPGSKLNAVIAASITQQPR